MTDEPPTPSEPSDAQLADLMTQLIASAMDPRKADQMRAVARRIEAADPGAMRRLSDRLDMRKVRQGRVTLQ